MEFCEGDVVVAPGCGLGHIEEIAPVEMGDDPVTMYVIVVEGDDVKLWVPTHRAVLDGIRHPVEADAVDGLLATIRDTEPPPGKKPTWNRRQRRYNELLMSNEPAQLAALLGELSTVRQTKDLSFGERRLFERAVDLMRRELLAAADDPEDVGLRFERAVYGS